LRDEAVGGVNGVGVGNGASSNGASQQSQSVPINKWTNERVLDWLCKRFPTFYESCKESFIQNEITGESLLQFNVNCLDQLKIDDPNLR
jgi:hypothetical protein